MVIIRPVLFVLSEPVFLKVHFLISNTPGFFNQIFEVNTYRYSYIIAVSNLIWFPQ